MLHDYIDLQTETAAKASDSVQLSRTPQLLHAIQILLFKIAGVNKTMNLRA